MTDMEIETFLTVLRSGSMTAAAQALYITQPTLSARLQTLEDEVGRTDDRFERMAFHKQY